MKDKHSDDTLIYVMRQGEKMLMKAREKNTFQQILLFRKTLSDSLNLHLSLPLIPQVAAARCSYSNLRAPHDLRVPAMFPWLQYVSVHYR